MKTAMQELIEKLESMIEHGGDADLLPALEHAKKLLEKEKLSAKELIIDFIKHAKSKKHLRILELKVDWIIDDYLNKRA